MGGPEAALLVSALEFCAAVEYNAMTDNIVDAYIYVYVCACLKV